MAVAAADTTLNTLASALKAKNSRRIALPRQTYLLNSPPGSRQDLLNFFAEAHPSDARSEMMLRSTPGVLLAADLGTGPVRATNDLLGLLYVISGTTAWRITAGEVPQAIGTVLGSDAPTIAVGPNQVVFCTPPKAYVANHGGTLTEITNEAFPGASSVAFLDNYFVFTQPNSGILFHSKLTDAGDFDPFAYASVEAVPGVLLRVVAHNGVLALFGFYSIEFWSDVGATPFAFQRISGGVAYRGTIAAATIAKFDNTLAWLGRDGVIYKLDGFSPKRISTHAIEQTLETYGGAFLDAVSGTYSQEGHEFYWVTFPTPDATFVYDAATGLWHRRSSAANGVGRWRANCSAMFGQVPTIGDYASGKLYFLQQNVPTDAGVTVAREAVFPPITSEAKRVIMHRLELEMETGSFTVPNAMTLDYSDDGGFSWKNPRALTAAQGTGVFTTRVFADRLGSFRERMLRLRMTGYATIYAADADMEGLGV